MWRSRLTVAAGSSACLLAIACTDPPVERSTRAPAAEAQSPAPARSAQDPRAPERADPDSARQTEPDPPEPSPPPPAPLGEAVTIEADVSDPPHPVPDGAPDAIVHLPRGLDPGAPIELVVFLHGWTGCARMLALAGRVQCAEGSPSHVGWGLNARHDAAGTNSIFVVPQLAFMERTGRPGGFAEDGAFRAYLGELLGGEVAEHLGGARSPDDFEITLVAHSAGYESALAILDHGGVPIHAIVLLDALYAGSDRFASWLAEDDGHVLISLFTGHASTYRESQRLIELTDGRARVERSPHPHGAIPREQLAGLLRDVLVAR